VPVTAVRLTRSRNAAGGLVVRLGVPLLDEYLEFLAGRCATRPRPNTGAEGRVRGGHALCRS
jgi:hypothetical protein